MHNRLVKLIIVMTIFFNFSELLAAEISSKISVENESQYSPYSVIKTSGEKLFARITENQEELKKFPNLMDKIVEEELLPIVDYQYIAYKVLGKHLRKSTKLQRVNFVDAMKENIIRAYANILRNYRGQKIIYELPKSIANKRIVSVPVKIIETSKPEVELLFKFRRQKKTGSWLIFDVLVEGISMLGSKQSEVSNRITKFGLEQVTKEIKYIRK